ncbi:hypothetical protein R3P38DRAFT_3182444 [Favolaschia claudopus]|uniref:Uncharacterized protein n=1 Tax=Favolaschia claudopus TaxID=2862362 RepID=A0AAW0CJK1_9AGAR
MSRLLDFVYLDETPSLVKDIFGADFHTGVYGSYAPDESRCTKADHSYFYAPFVMGRVCEETTYRSADRHFKIDGGDDPDSKEYKAFQNQIAQLEAMAVESCYLDIEDNSHIEIRRCTEPLPERREWFTSNDTIIRVNCLDPRIFREREGQLEFLEPSRTADYPLQVGDWVLIQCAIHRYEDAEFWGQRLFRVIAHNIRILSLIVDTACSDDNGPTRSPSIDSQEYGPTRSPSIDSQELVINDATPIGPHHVEIQRSSDDDHPRPKRKAFLMFVFRSPAPYAIACKLNWE